jgi:putative transposase
VKFIAANRERWGVEPISRVLQFAPATYYAAGTRPASARAIRDQELTPQIQRVWNENFGVYGADKVWAQMRREGFLVARCTVERLMRELGLRGVVQGKTTRTTVAADGTDRPADLVDRHVVAAAPNRLWVADLTYVKTHSGWVYLAFIGDVFSRYVVGWQVSRSLRTDLALDALEMASWGRRGEQLPGLVHHTDRGCQPGFKGSSHHLNDQELRCKNEGDVDRVRLVAHRCGRLVALRWRGVRIGSGSGWRSRTACRARTPLCAAGCPGRWARWGPRGTVTITPWLNLSTVSTRPS